MPEIDISVETLVISNASVDTGENDTDSHTIITSQVGYFQFSAVLQGYSIGDKQADAQVRFIILIRPARNHAGKQGIQ